MNSGILGRHYHQIWSDLREARTYIFAAIVLFVAGNILVLLIPHVGEKVISLALEYFKPFKDKNYLELLVAIFLQNASSTFLAIIFGFLFGCDFRPWIRGREAIWRKFYTEPQRQKGTKRQS